MTITINGNGTVTGVSVGGLPDGIVDTDMIAANAVTEAKTTVPGIIMTDAYKVTSNFSGTSYITSNWARDTTRGGGNKGSAMSESSGVFTFPSTGIYLVHFQARGSINNVNNREVIIQIFFTSDNSNYEETANAAFNQYDSNSTTHDSCNTQKILDITDVSNQKVKFRVQTNESAFATYGDSSISFTFAQFTRLGDT